eukprot:scaffold22735_cov207-Cylindrotheca_fusiformis.AAC.2
MMRCVQFWVFALCLVGSGSLCEAKDDSMHYRRTNRALGKGKGSTSAVSAVSAASSTKATPPPTPSPTPPPTSKPTGKPTETPVVSFTSFLSLELETTNGIPDDYALENAADLVVSTYNEAAKSCDDPFERELVDASLELVSVRGRMLGSQDSRELQYIILVLYLRVGGRCRGCDRDPFLFNQVNRRNLGDQCVVPSPKDFLKDYNAVISGGGYGSIVGAAAIEDISEIPSVSSSKKSKKSPSKGSATKKSASRRRAL